MNRYAEYKESGLNWIGKIPSHWEIKKLKRVSEIETGTTPPTINENYYNDGTTPWVKPENLNGMTSIKFTTRKLTELGVEKSRLLRANTVLVCGIGTIGKFGFATEPVCTNQQINGITFYEEIVCSRFGLYLISSMVDEFKRISEKVVVSILTKTRQQNCSIAFPSLNEQFSICQYLDKKTFQIDSLIEKIERKIELLIEQRTTLISQCVTKGLDPNVQMKDSGVEWIGEIPIDWSTTPLKYVVSSNDEVLSENTNPGCEFRYIEISDVNQFSGIGPGKKLSFSISPSRARRILRENDVLISTVRTYLRAIGTVRKCRGNLIGSTGFCVLRATQRILPSFLSYIVNSEQFVASVVSNSVGVSYPAINSSDLVNLKSVLPSLHEQAQISQYLDQKTSRIDSLSNKLQRKIELLKEYRQSLISNVVTGKVKVTEDAS